MLLPIGGSGSVATGQNHPFALLAEAMRLGLCVRLGPYRPLARQSPFDPTDRGLQREHSDQGLDQTRKTPESRGCGNEPGSMIKSPTLPVSHPDRELECEIAMEADDFALLDRGREVRDEEFRTLALRATASGWTGEEVGAAMISLAEKYVAARKRRTPSIKIAEATNDGAAAPNWSCP
jgi:hypothetical protein